MSLEIIIPIATVVILLLLFTWLVKVLQSTIKTALVIVAILVLLQIAFGINSEQIIQQVIQSVEQIKDLAMDQLNN
ncbi:MAG: hypothetical protein AAFO76_10745 [Cyanobacteria bacterium J06607_15]